MDTHNLASLAEKTKKPSQLKSLLYAQIVDRDKLKEYFLENHTCLPQEHRLPFWKVMLDVWSVYPNQYPTIDLILKNHYEYLKSTVRDVLKVSHKNEAELNYCIYLLDRDLLPLNESDIVCFYSFSLFFFFKRIHLFQLLLHNIFSSRTVNRIHFAYSTNRSATYWTTRPNSNCTI